MYNWFTYTYIHAPYFHFTFIKIETSLHKKNNNTKFV